MPTSVGAGGAGDRREQREGSRTARHRLVLRTYLCIIVVTHRALSRGLFSLGRLNSPNKRSEQRFIRELTIYRRVITFTGSIWGPVVS